MYVLDDRHLDELSPPTGLRDTRPPPAPALLRRSRVCWPWVVERCPLCRRRHQHGGPLSRDPRRLLSHRVAHCDERRRPAGPPDGYVLIDADPDRTAACIANYHGALRWDP